MKHKIAILTDFSYCSEKATQVGIELFGFDNVAYTLIHSIYVRQAGSLLFMNFSEDIKKFSERTIKATQERYIQQYPSLEIDVKVEIGSVTQTVEHLCEEEHWDCFILGANGSSNMYERILGSSAKSILKEAKTNILVVPVTSKNIELRNASLPLEITKNNLALYTDKVKHLLTKRIEKIDFFMIYDSQDEADSLQRIINKWSKSEHELPHEVSLFKNNQEELENQIIEIAENQATDLLILAPNKEKSFWQRIFDHSVSEGVIENSHLPVLILN